MKKRLSGIMLNLALIFTMIFTMGIAVNAAEGDELPVISELSITSDLASMTFDTDHPAKYMDFTVDHSGVILNRGSCYWSRLIINSEGLTEHKWISQNANFEVGKVAYHYSMYVLASEYKMESTLTIHLDGETITVNPDKSGEEYYINFWGPEFTVTEMTSATRYDVNFDTQCEATVPSQKICEGYKAYEPEKPTNGDMKFAGWYIDAACTTPFDFDTPITENITLYAKWEPDSREVIDSLTITSDLASMTFDTDHPAKYMAFTVDHSGVILNNGSCYWSRLVINSEGLTEHKWISQNANFEVGKVAYHYSMYVLASEYKMESTVTIHLDGETITVNPDKSGEEYYINFWGPEFTVENPAPALIDINTLPWCSMDDPIPYTGEAIEPPFYQFLTEVPDGFIRHEQFETTYSNNVNPGIATLTITGIGNYTGTKTLLYTIRKSEIGSIELSSGSYYYDGKAKTPSITVVSEELNTIADKITKTNENVNLTYASGRKLPGSYKVTAKGQGIGYTGTASASFKIVIKPTKMKSLVAGKKNFKVTCTKQSGTYITGYQLRYSTSSSMAKAKTVTVGTKNTAVSKTVKSLKSKKTYYVQVRTYKTIKGKKYYSAWSSKKSVKVK